ncbi:GDP-L-fucose synthase [Desulfosarcina alkanivorans]|uniref:GDP-L-fucose synthase n=1 Tax=Desulfosarcina alkanivorans TaxID=571177 RepID=A0A5K7YIP5_9BACT|nr:GDP-L-fucose synthase [Desulfosarcina alkanivorans]BBO68403.1 GDP-L-fucose synthase [Desulfosarcina alkanivorans]
MQKNARIFIAGHAGLVGSALVRRLESAGYTRIITRTRSELDLLDQEAVADFFQAEKPAYVFLAAAKVGGIHANNTFPAEFIYQNMAIQNHVIHQSYVHGVKRLLFLGSSCIYPKLAPQPMKEEHLLTGLLEPTNEPYAIAKIAGIKMCESYNRQYGTRFMAVMPTNLYGTNDNFNLENSHVLPALIRKFHLTRLAANGDIEGIQRDEACFGPIPHDIKHSLTSVLSPQPSPGTGATQSPVLSPQSSSGTEATQSPALSPQHSVVVWGTGSPKREFLHVDDMADACVHVMNLDDKTADRELLNYPTPCFVNVGSGVDGTIRQLAEVIQEVVGFKGEVVFDASKPDGTPQKLLDVSRLAHLGWRSKISLKEGIRQAYEWYLKSAER